MFDDNFTHVAYNYFSDDPIVEESSGTYAEPEADIQFSSITWNHSICEVLQSLLSQNLALNSFLEYDYSPYNCFRHTSEITPGRYPIAHLGKNIPMVYALRAQKTK